MNAINPEQLELDPIEVDPRPCRCGLTIDQHRMVDIGEGPEFFCDDAEYQIHLNATDLVRQWELADPRDRWKHTGEAPPPSSNIPDVGRRPYRTAESTVAAFWYVISLNDLEYLKAWLANHPADAPTLLELLERK
jgi:hypothetical protein